MKKILMTLLLAGLIQISANAAYSIADQAMDSTKYEEPSKKDESEKAGRILADTGKEVKRVKGRDQ